MRAGWVLLLFSPNSILEPVIGYRSSLYAAVVPSRFLASDKLNKNQVLNTFYALEYQMFFAISRNGALLIFIIASYENVSSIHIPYSRCLTWVHCMKSQSCVHKFNIFSPFTAVQWISYREWCLCPDSKILPLSFAQFILYLFEVRQVYLG